MSTFFARHYDALMGQLEQAGFSRIRAELLRKAAGRTLEIGSGTGLNFPCYQGNVEVTALEPSETMRAASLDRAAGASVPIEVMAGDAEHLPFANDTFDTVVGTLVLCTIPDPYRALCEIRRVCRPGGTLLFFEHIRLQHALLGPLQDLLTPAWKHLCDGCHLNRDTAADIRRAGLRIVQLQPHYRGVFVTITAAKE